MRRSIAFFFLKAILIILYIDVLRKIYWINYWSVFIIPVSGYLLLRQARKLQDFLGKTNLRIS